MSGRYQRIFSPDLEREVHLWSYGHFGPPVVVFPTAAGFAHEWQSQGMIDALQPLLAAGKLKLYCPESNVAEAWTRKENDPRWRIKRHQAYERFFLRTLIPHIREDCHLPNARVATVGASLGAMYAANMALKHPELVWWSLCMSGRYDARGFTDGFQNSDIYFDNPLAYAPNLAGNALARVAGQTKLTLVCGQGLWEENCIEETIALAHVLRAKGIPVERDLWGRDVKHDWEWWQRQALFHFSRAFA